MENKRKLPVEVRRGSLVCVVSSAILALSLSGCSGNDISDLQRFVAQEKSKPAGRIPPVPEFKTYTVFPYGASKGRDPFQPMMDDPSLVADGLRPDQNRNKESLEQYPLDTLKYVGSLERDGGTWAIITSPDNLVHRIKTGNFIGQNFGKIIAIDETRIDLIEVVPDGQGGWIERDAALSIIE